MAEQLSELEREWQRERAAEQVRRLSAELTANLLRVVRGAGRSYEIAQHCAALVQAYETFQSVDGHYPPSAIIEQAVQWGRDIDYGDDREHQANRDYAEEQVISGALQIVASRILGQSTQEAAGRREFHAGLRDWQAASEAIRKHWATQPRPNADAIRAMIAAVPPPSRKRPNDK